MEKFDAKRVDGLVAKAIKSSKEHKTVLIDASAAAMYAFVAHGQYAYLNKLFIGLQPTDQYGLRAMYFYKIMDVFGVGGERDGDGKWLKRPPHFARFDAKGGEDGKTFFKLVKLDGNTDTALASNIKATKKAIIDAGEDALKIEWMTKDEAANNASVYDLGRANKAMFGVLMQWAKNGAKIGKTWSDIERIAQITGGSTQENIMKLKDEYLKNVIPVSTDARPAETKADEEKKPELIKQVATPNNVSDTKETVNA